MSSSQDNIDSASDVSFNTNIMENNRILHKNSPSSISTVYKMLRTRLLQTFDENSWKSIGIISPTYNEGKTTTAINLSISIAQEPNHSCLLVDLNFVSPMISSYFNLNPNNTINDALKNKCDVTDTLLNIDDNFYSDLTIAPAQTENLNTSTLLASKEASNISQEVKNKLDGQIIIYDLPPILATDDAIAFLPNLDAVILVVREGVTDQTDLFHVKELLGEKPIASIILNDATHNHRSIN